MKNKMFLFATLLMSLILFRADSCDNVSTPQPKSASGVTKATVSVPTNAITGLTIEQQNVKDRLLMDNKPGSIKHLYVISSMSGQCLIYSTVRGKVTSSGKRLTPTSVSAIGGEYGGEGEYIDVNISGRNYKTSEVLQDDGTYGQSSDYIYWWDSKNIYHMLFITGGMIVHISDQPMAVKSVVMNFEDATKAD